MTPQFQLVLSMLALLSVGAVRANGPASAPAAPPTAPPASASAPANPANVKPAIERQETRAQLMPRRYTTLAAEIGAKINRVPFTEGTAFKAGDELVVFDCGLQQAQLRKAQAELEAAESTYRANVELAKLNSVGQLELEQSQAALNRAKAELGANQTVISKCQILAPYGGRVAEQKVREQQFVQVGQPLLDILDDSVLELEFLVPSSWLSWLRPGRRFNFQIDETRRAYPARLVRIGARVDPVSQSIKVAATIDGKFPGLVAGMSGTVLITPP